MNEEINIIKALNSEKIKVLTTIPKEVKFYIDKRNIDVNRLIEIGFRHLAEDKGLRQSIDELGNRVKIIELKLKIIK